MCYWIFYCYGRWWFDLRGFRRSCVKCMSGFLFGEGDVFVLFLFVSFYFSQDRKFVYKILIFQYFQILVRECLVYSGFQRSSEVGSKRYVQCISRVMLVGGYGDYRCYFCFYFLFLNLCVLIFEDIVLCNGRWLGIFIIQVEWKEDRVFDFVGCCFFS